MTLKNTNPWKLLSIGLLGIIAIGLLTPIDAVKPEPKENEATEVDCENPCIDETELTFETATQAELDILDGTVAGLIIDLATETSERQTADTALDARIAALEERIYKCDDLAGADLSGQDLSGEDFSGCDLTDADLTGADLTGADLTGADLTGATIFGVDLTNTTLGSFYIDDTFYGSFLTGFYNNCNGGNSDTSIGILDTDYSSWLSDHYINADEIGLQNASEVTVFTILCETT